MIDDFTSDGLYKHALRELPWPTGTPGRPQKPTPGIAASAPIDVCVCARPIVWGRHQRGRCERCGGIR